MKVIDLLNKIANGEELPRKFMVDGDTLYIGEDKYIEYESGKKIKWLIYPSWLNEEVEIIGENKKIEKIPYHFSLNFVKSNLTNEEKEGIDEAINGIYDKINEIVDRINELEDK